MNIKDLFTISSAIIASLGGGALLVIALSNWLGKLWANRFMNTERAKHEEDLEQLRSQLLKEIEGYKIALKNSEFIFQKQYEAASELVALQSHIAPKYTFPEMDWHDACEYIATGFKSTEKLIDAYLAKHGAVLSVEVKDLLLRSVGLCSTGKFQVKDGNVSPAAVKNADLMYQTLKKALDSMLKVLMEQTAQKGEQEG